jgi:hypothetical protein
VAVEQELLRRLEITTQTVTEVLAGGDDHQVGGRLDPGPHPEGEAAAAAPQGTTVGLPVPVFGQDQDGRRLPVAYRDVVEVADAGPLRASQVCQALGLPAEAKRREGMRIKLKRLVARGWLVVVSPGLFGCAAG